MQLGYGDFGFEKRHDIVLTMIVINLERPHLDSDGETKTDDDSNKAEPIEKPAF